MLGTEVELLLKEYQMTYVATDCELDINNFKQLNDFSEEIDLSWIINCAAYNAVDQAEDNQETAFKVNAEGPRNIAHIARSKKASLIHISTDYVFDGTKETAYHETDIPNPLGVYGKSKLQGELNVIETIKKFFIIRTAWLFGKNGPNFVYTMLRQFEEKNDVKVVADQWGSPTYAPDLADFIIQIIQRVSMDYGIYHFTNEGRITWYQFAGAIYERAKAKGIIPNTTQLIPIETREYPTKAKRPLNAILSKEKTSKVFDLKLRPWQESLADFISKLPGSVE
jgi:dTDP-4-dehydrorhamnose reductase